MVFWFPFVGLPNADSLAKWAGVATWILSACLMYLVLVQGHILGRGAALLTASLAVALPIFDVLGVLSLWMNSACVALFWCGWLMLFRLHGQGTFYLLGRGATLLVFFLAFNLNSQLVFFYAFGVVAFILPRLECSIGTVVLEARLALMRQVDFFCLPIAFWLWKKVFTPTEGYYADYNKLQFSPEVLARTCGSLFEGFIAGEVKALFESSLWVVVTFVVVLFAALLLQRRGAELPVVGTAKDGMTLVLSGAFLLIAGAFPYAVVDQSFSSFGWLSRNCILLPLPLGMMTVGGLTLVGAKVAPRRPAIVWLAVAFVALLAVGSSNRTILRWQALGAKQESIGTKLRGSFASEAPAFVQLRDYFIIPNTVYFYPPIIWTYLLARGLKTPQTFVVETSQMAPDQLSLDAAGVPQRRVTVLDVDQRAIEAAIEQTTMPYAMMQIPRHGRQTLAVVEAGDLGEDGVRIGWQALKTRWLQPWEMPKFLDRVTRMQVRDLPRIPAE